MKKVLIYISTILLVTGIYWSATMFLSGPVHDSSYTLSDELAVDSI